MDTTERLNQEARDQIEYLISRTPSHLLEEGWVGSADETPDFAIQTTFKDVGLIGIFPISRKAREFMGPYLGSLRPHVEACSYADLLPVGILSRSLVFIVSLPVWASMAADIQEEGLSMLLDPPQQRQGEKTDAEIGEGTIGRPDTTGGEGIGPEGVIGFRFRLGPDGNLEIEPVDSDGNPTAPREQEEPPPPADEALLMRRASRVAALSKIRHMVPIVLGEDLLDGWYGAPRPEPADGEDPPCSDVQVVMDGGGGMLLLHPHTDKGRAFLGALADGTYGLTNYAYRVPVGRDELGDRVSIDGIDPEERFPEYVAAITSWPLVITLADTVAGVTLHFSYDEEGNVPCMDDEDGENEDE